MNFNDALNQAADLAKARLAALQEDVFLVRDLNGRIRVLLASPEPGTRTKKAFEDALKGLSQDVVSALGTYAYPKKDLFLFRSELASLSLPTSAAAPVLREDVGFKVCLHDRLLMTTEWSDRLTPECTSPRRFTLYSMKGGVGRSTTAAVLAHHLASRGKRVLVFDLDLESPGIGATLLGDKMPQFGIIDWFVEDALGQGETVLGAVSADSPLSIAGEGRITVIPAFGTDTGDYLPKLGRAYLERGPTGHESWTSRLQRFVRAIEEREQPDFVLLDSRTGLHDTSASLVLAMGAATLMFAVDTAQTWTAYRFLFQHWANHPDHARFRDKLWLIGAQVPDTNRDDYLRGLADNAYELFAEHMYDPLNESDPDAFHAAPDDRTGNHYPRPIFWQRVLASFDPLKGWPDIDVTAAYTGFLNWFDATWVSPSEVP